MCIMFRNVSVFFLLFYSVSSAVSAGNTLPAYFKKCEFYSYNLDSCFGDAASRVIPKLVQGNADFNFPPLTPFGFPEVSSPHDASFQFRLTNGIAGNLQDARYLSATYDRKTYETNGTLFFPQLYVRGNYEISGKIDDLPVDGRGVANIVFFDVACYMNWNLSSYFRHDVEYFNTLDLKIEYQIEGANYHFSGLHDGERTLKHLNKNWKTLAKIIAPSVIATIRLISLYISRSIAIRVPIREIFIVQ